MVFQSTIGPFPIQPLANGARDLGDTQGGVVASRQTHQCDIFRGKTPPGKTDDGGMVHETLEDGNYELLGISSSTIGIGDVEQFHDLIEGVFALLTARGENAEQNLLSVGRRFQYGCHPTSFAQLQRDATRVRPHCWLLRCRDNEER